MPTLPEYVRAMVGDPRDWEGCVDEHYAMWLGIVAEIVQRYVGWLKGPRPEPQLMRDKGGSA